MRGFGDCCAMKLEADQGGLAAKDLCASSQNSSKTRPCPFGCSPQLIALRLCCPVTCASEAVRVALVDLSQCVTRGATL